MRVLVGGGDRGSPPGELRIRIVAVVFVLGLFVGWVVDSVSSVVDKFGDCSRSVGYSYIVR
jgi:hypothetical protein